MTYRTDVVRKVFYSGFPGSAGFPRINPHYCKTGLRQISAAAWHQMPNF
jgi:hypothetical protein